MLENNPIILILNLDETAVGAQAIVDRMEARGLSGQITMRSTTPTLGSVAFNGHTTLVAALAVLIDNINATELKVAPPVPALHIFPGKKQMHLPRSTDDMLPDRQTGL